MQNNLDSPMSAWPADVLSWAVVFGLALALLNSQSAPARAESPLLPESVVGRFAEASTIDDAKASPANASTHTLRATDGPAEGGLSSVPALDARSRYRILIQKEATRTGLAPEIAEAVMAVESGYNPGAIGGVGEIGLMQILPSTARMLGFVGTNADLATPETNIHYGVSYLSQAWRLARGDLCTAVMKYRAGHGESRFSYLSVNYCLAVRSKLAARGFPVTGTVPVATFGDAIASSCRRRCLGTPGLGRVNLAALNTKLSSIVMQVRATR
jgi:soluble lytic murein transglycosylase-like protein